MSVQSDLVALAISQLGSGAYKYRNWFYGSDMHGVAWCAVFVSWIANQCNLINNCFIKTDGAGCFAREGIKANKKYGTWIIAKRAVQPIPGDLILFRNWNIDYNDAWHADHVGIITGATSCNDGTWTVNTIEGNTNGDNDTSVVAAHSYNTSSGYVYGYYRPNYATAPKSNQHKVYISPSNQINNTYKFGNTNEMDQMYKVGTYLQSALARCSISSKLAIKGQAMATSISDSNAYIPELHVCIHSNATMLHNITGGTMVMVFDNSQNNFKAGNAILAEVAKITPGNDYDIQYRPDLSELEETNSVAIYCETEFHDTVQGAKWIINNTKNLAESLCKGICNYFNVPYIIDSKNPSDSTTDDKNLILKEGDWSDGVLSLKAMLNIAHLLGLINFSCDDKRGFGVGTKKCVEDFQSKNGMKITGTADINFINALKEAISKNINSATNAAKDIINLLS